MARPMGSDLLATKVRFCKSTSLQTYLREVDSAVKPRPPEDLFLPHVDQRLRIIAQRDRGGSSAHNLISGLRALEKVGLLPPHQAEPLWVYAKAIDKTTVGNLKPQRWTTAADLQILGNAWGHWAWTRVFFFSMLAVVYCLKVGDLESICWAYISSSQFFTFWDEKCNCRLTSFPLSPYLETWREHVCTLRLPHHHDFTSVFPGGTKSLRFYLGELLKDTDSAGLQWHCHKHMGAAAFMAQGGSTRGLQMWARWRSPQMARHYAAHPPTWRLPPTLHLPLPERPGPGRAYTRVRINTRDSWPKQAFKDNPRPYAPPPAHVEVTRPEPASGDHGDDSDTDTNEDPRTSEVPPPLDPIPPQRAAPQPPKPKAAKPESADAKPVTPQRPAPPPPLNLPAAPPTAAAPRPNVHLQRDPGAPLGTSSSGEDSKTSVVAGMSTPPLVYPTPPRPEPAPPPSTIPRGCSLHANSTHEPTLLARDDLRRRVPTPPPCRRGHRRVRGRQCHQRCL